MLRITVDGTESFCFDDNGNMIFLKPATIYELLLAKGLAPSNSQYTFRSGNGNISMQSKDMSRNNPMTGKTLVICINLLS